MKHRGVGVWEDQRLPSTMIEPRLSSLVSWVGASRGGCRFLGGYVGGGRHGYCGVGGEVVLWVLVDLCVF